MAARSKVICLRLCLVYDVEHDAQDHPTCQASCATLGKMIKPAQCRAARGLVELDQSELAIRASVARNTVVDFEKGRRTPNPNNLAAIQNVLETAGVEFIPENGGGPGVRLKKRSADDRGPKPAGPATDVVDATDKDRARLASVKETGEEVPQEDWERFEAADKKPTK